MAAELPDVIDETLLHCPLCMRVSRSPKLLPCLHQFCESCLDGYVDQWRRDEYLTVTGRRSDVRHSGTGSDVSTGRKRVRQPERYTDRDSLMYHGTVYREKYRRSHDNQPPTDGLSAAATERKITRSVSSPVSVSAPNSLNPGKVSNIVNLYEQKASDSKSPLIKSSSTSRENTPPLATFRAKSHDSPSAVLPNRPKLLPLSERPLPAHPTTVANDNPPQPITSNQPQPIKRDQAFSSEPPRPIQRQPFSHDPPRPIQRQQFGSERPQPISSQESYDSALGTGDSDKQLVFVDGRTDRRRLSSPDENVYEGIELCGHYSLARSSPLLRRRRPRLTKETSDEVADHIYDTIQSRRQSTTAGNRQTISRGASVPDLLADAIESQLTDSVFLPERRNSTTLDSYVTAVDLSGHRRVTSELSREVPVSAEDSRRLSQLYMRMDGRSAEPRLASQSYVPMDELVASPVVSPTEFVGESVATIIRSISDDFRRRTMRRDLEPAVNEEPETPRQEAIYSNTSAGLEEEGEELELDMPIPIYETSKPVLNATTAERKSEYYNTDSKPTPTADKQLPCPTCQREFVVPGNQVSRLPDCSFASQLQEVVQMQNCDRKQCGHCESKTAAYKCLDCQLDLCSGCQRGHAWSRSNKGHKVMTLEELQSGKFQTEIKGLQTTGCRGNDCAAPAGHYCGTCNLPLCAECLLRHPSHHQSAPLTQVAERERDFIRAATSALQSREEVFLGALDSLQTYQTHCAGERAAILSEISAHHEYLSLVLDRTFDFLRARVTAAYDREAAQTDARTDGVRGQLRTLDHVTRVSQQLTEHGNHGSVVAMGRVVRDEIRRLRGESPTVMSAQTRVRYAPPDVTLQDVQPLVGDIAVTSVPLQPAGDLATGAGDLGKLHSHQMELVAQFTSRLDTDAKGCRPNGVAVSRRTGDVVIVDDINKKLKVFDASGRLQTEICPTGDAALKDPWDIAILGTDNIAVTDKGANDVKIFTPGGSLVRTFGSHLRKPWGIATNSRGDIVVTDTELRRVFVHDSQGNLKLTLPHTSVKAGDDYSLRCPEYVCCNLHDDIIVSDFENHRILAFDSLGRPLFRFGKKGKGAEEFDHPLGVATDTDGNIYVVNYQNQRITVVTRNGHFLCCLTAAAPLQSLQTLCLDTRGHLVVVNGSDVRVFRVPRPALTSHVTARRPSHVTARTGHVTGRACVRLYSDRSSGERKFSARETTV